MVAVAGSFVAVGGTFVAVGGTGVAVGGAFVAVGGAFVAVGGTFVAVGAVVLVGGTAVGNVFGVEVEIITAVATAVCVAAWFFGVAVAVELAPHVTHTNWPRSSSQT